MQGAATSVWAATAAELDDLSGAYLADCHVELPHAMALDPQVAEQLWKVGGRAVECGASTAAVAARSAWL
jgi:hypothetical protein